MRAFSDAHLDIAWSSLQNGRDFVVGHPDAAAGLPELLAGGVTLACATVFTAERDDDESTAKDAAERQLAYYDALPGRSEGKVIWPADVMDVGMCVPGEKICLVGLMEGCEPLSEPEEMGDYYRRGVRVAALTWNRNNRWAAGCDGNTGLTMDGVALVKEMDRLGMVHDVSHLSRMSVDDLARHGARADHREPRRRRRDLRARAQPDRRPPARHRAARRCRGAGALQQVPRRWPPLILRRDAPPQPHDQGVRRRWRRHRQRHGRRIRPGPAARRVPQRGRPAAFLPRRWRPRGCPRPTSTRSAAATCVAFSRR